MKARKYLQKLMALLMTVFLLMGTINTAALAAGPGGNGGPGGGGQPGGWGTPTLSYEWSGSVPDGVSLPGNQPAQWKGWNQWGSWKVTVDSGYSDITTEEGTWSFNGWYNGRSRVTGSEISIDRDTTVYGSWTFTEKVTPTPTPSPVPENGDYVYCYVEVTGNAPAGAVVNAQGWYTVGYYYDSSLSKAADLVRETQATIPSNPSITREHNTWIDLGTVKWKELHVCYNATDYQSDGKNYWHLDGEIDANVIPTFKVEYKLNGGTGDFNDSNEYQPGATVRVLDGEPKREGYTFAGWSYNDTNTIYRGGNTFSMPGSDVTLEAQWTKNPVASRYTVVHEYYTNGDKDGTYEVYVTSGVYEDDVINASSISKVLTHGGKTYTFTSADPTSITLGSDLTKNVITLRYDRSTYSVTYTWTGAPASEQGHIPAGEENIDAGGTHTVDTEFYKGYTVLVYDEQYNNLIGQYVFSGWDREGTITVNSNITISGSWEYKSVDPTYHKVSYDWGTANIPAGVSLPGDMTGLVKNQTYTVDKTYYEGYTVVVTDAYGNETGKYTFSGWTDPGKGKMGDEDITITGSWSYEAKTVGTHNITYRWAGLPDADLFNGEGNPITPVLPTDSTSYVKGQSYTVDKTYTSSSVVYTHDEFGNNNASYTFSGWDHSDGTMGDSDIEITGRWVKNSITVPTHKVRYTWNLPDGMYYTEGGIVMTPELPSGENVTHNGSHTVVSTNYGTMYTHDTYGNVNGKYTFKGWDHSGTINNITADVEIKGTWTLETVTVATHKVTYSWTGLPAGTKLYDINGNETNPTLPTDNNSYVKGQHYTVDSTMQGTEVYTHDAYGNINAKYTLSAWTDPNSGVMGTADVTVTAVWTGETVDVDKFVVSYSWDGNVPPADKVTLPDSGTYSKNQLCVVDKTYTNSTVIEDRDAKGVLKGTWSFTGWDKTEDFKVTAHTQIKGTWTYTAAKYTVTFVDEDGKTVLLDAAEYDYGTKAAAIVKPADPTKASDGVYTYEFAGWTPEITDVTDDAVYTATYTRTKIQNEWTVVHEYYVDTDDVRALAGTKDGGKLEIDADVTVNVAYAMDHIARDTTYNGNRYTFEKCVIDDAEKTITFIYYRSVITIDPVQPTPTPTPTPEVTPEITPEITPEVTPEPSEDVDIPEETPPLVDLPDDNVPVTDLPDEDVPMSDVPVTGDSSTAILFWVLAVLSGAALAYLSVPRKSGKHSAK